MNEDRYAQYGMATGIVFAILLVVGFLVVIPAPPDLDAPVDQWSQYYHDHQGAIRAGLILITISNFFLIWFVGCLASVLRVAAGSPRLPSIAFAGGVLVVGSTFVIITATGVATLRPDELSPELTKTMNDVGILAGLPAISALMAFFGATSVVIFRSNSGLPIWLGWLTLIAAAVQPLSFGIVFTDSGAFAGDGVLGLFIPFGVAIVTVVALSIILTSWARDAARAGGMGFTDRVRGAVTGAATGAAAGARGERPPGS